MNAASPSPLRYALAGMVGMAAAMGIGRFVFTPILPSMMEELHLTPVDAGWIASANFLGYLLGAFAAAGAWGAGRERMLMLTALAANAILAASMGLTNSVAAFVVIRLLAGIASAFVMVFLASIVLSHIAAAGKEHLQSVHFAGVGLGIALSSLMMASLTVAQAPWADGWFGAAIISAVGFAIVAASLDKGPLQKSIGATEPALPRDGHLMRVIFAYGLFGFGYIVTATFLVAIVRQGKGPEVFEPLVWLVTGIAAIPSIYLWGMVARRRGPVAAYVAASVVQAIGVAASVSIGGWAGPVVGGALLGATFMALTALGLQIGRMLAPQSPRRVFAMMTGAFGVGQIFGPVVAGALAERTGSYFAPSMLAALVLLASGAIVWRPRS